MNSVKVYTDEAGERTIELENGNGDVINDLLVNIPETGDDGYIIELNWDIPTGNNYILTTNTDLKEIEDYKLMLDSEKITYRDLKRKLARNLVSIYYSKVESLDAERNFDKLFIKNQIPDNIEELEYKHFKLIGYEPHPSIKAEMVA